MARTKESIKITKDHIKLLKNMHVTWGYAAFGAPSIDPKRPYGNSDVLKDIVNITGIKRFRVNPNYEYEDDQYYELTEYLSEEHEYKLQNLHKEMQIVLQILTLYPDKGIKAGQTYEKRNEYDDRSWKLIK